MFSCEYCEIFNKRTSANGFFCRDERVKPLVRTLHVTKIIKLNFFQWSSSILFMPLCYPSTTISFETLRIDVRTKFKHTILAVMFWQWTVFPYKFDLPQVKRDLICRLINFISELPNDLRMRMLWNYQISGIFQNWVGIQLVTSLRLKNQVLVSC